MRKTCLSVNVNKVAVLRNARGGQEPDVVRAAEAVIAAGADGITVHPRPDARHIRAEDVRRLAQCCRGRVELNIEGNPFAPPRAGYPGLIALCEEVVPEQVTLVPDGDGQLTSDHGMDLAGERRRLEPIIQRLHELGTRVSVFVDAGVTDLHGAAALGIHRLEIYTGPYAQAHAAGSAHTALADCVRTARAAQAHGLGINAGHDLCQENLAAFLAAVPGVLEVSIGHALICEALYAGLDATVRAYLELVQGARRA